jgi:hypothetical protein
MTLKSKSTTVSTGILEEPQLHQPDTKTYELNRSIGTGGVVSARTPKEYQHVERKVTPFGVVPALAPAGGAAKFHDNGGPVLENARIQLVFWGNAWAANPAPTPSANQVATGMTNLLASPYLSALSQYRNNLGQASLRGTTMVTNSNPQNPFSDQNVIDMLTGLLNNGTLPNPLFETVLYMVVMPQGVNNTGSGFIGEHTFFNFQVQLGFFTVTVPVHFAWITNNGTLDSVTTIMSHELVESITDPEGSAILGNAGVCNQGGWCEIGDVCNTAGRVNGVQVQSYWSDVDDACIIPDGMVAGPVSGNPVLVQSRFGTKGNFEVVVPQPTGGLAHYWRNDDDPYLAWHGPSLFGSGVFDSVTMIQSNFGSPGNLETIGVQNGNLIFFWRDSGPGFHWSGPAQIGSGVHGVPALTQSRFGSKGNFELAAPARNAGIKVYWRNNDDPALPWSSPITIGQSLGRVDAVSLIQSNFGNPGNLELMALAGGNLYFFWRDSGPAFQWNGPQLIASGISGNVKLIQSRFGSKGNFEMVAPLSTGGLAHFWRNNDLGSLPWSAPIPFGGSQHIDEVSLIESNFGSPGNLEVVARIGNRMVHYWRDSGPAFHWNGPFYITR